MPLRALVAMRAPSDWSAIILAFIRHLCWPHRMGSGWDATDALRFVERSGGRLISVSPDQMRDLRSTLLDAPYADDFLWLLKWLKKPKNSEPALYEEMTRTPGLRKKVAALTAGVPYLTPSQKMSRANDRRRRAAQRKLS